jgi:hypothetical protein
MDSAKQLRDLSKVYMEAVYGGGKKEEKKDTRLVVTAADKKANTKAYQNYKAGNKAYKAADHLKEDEKYGYDKDGNSLNPKDKKAKKDFDGDGKLESPEAEYKGSKDKAIKKELKDLQKAAKTGKGKYVAKADKVKGVGESVESDEYIEIVREIKSAETQADIKRWKSLEESGKFTAEEIDTIMEADIADILARLEKKRISKGGDPDESPLGKKVGQAMKSQQDKARKKAGLKTEEIELDEAERSIADRLDRKNKLMKKTTRKAMDDARNTGEASGHNRFNMSRLGDEIDKLAAKQK